MARDFESFIVDPSLLDPSIDATDLRTTTDTRQELLSDVPDYAGIQFDPTRTSYLDDLYALYSGQLFMTPTATTPAVGSPTDEGGGGGVGVETPATITPSTPITTDLTDDQINEFVTEDTTMPPMLSPDMIGDIDTTPVDTTPPNMSPLADEQFVGTDSGLDYFDMNLIDNPFAGTPVSTPSGNNPFGLEDPTSLAIGPDGAVDFGTGGLEDEGQAVGEEFAGTPVNTPSGNNPFGYEDLNPSLMSNPNINNPGAFNEFDIDVNNTQQTPVEQAPPGIMNPYDPSQSTVLGEPGIDRLDTSEVDIPDNYFTDDSSTDIQDIPVELTTTNIDPQVVSNPSAVNTILGTDGITYDAVTGLPVSDDPIMDSNLMDIRQQQNLELNQIQDESLREKLSSVFTNARNVGKSAIETAQELVDKGIGTYNDLNKTVNVPGLGEIDIGKTLAGLALNSIVGAPISLVIGALNALGIKGGRSNMSDALGEKYGMDDIGRLTGGPMAGYSVDSAFGDIRQATVDRINKRKENNLDTTSLEQFLSEIDYLGGDPVGANTETDIDTDNVTGDASVAEDAEAGGLQGALDARDDLAGVATGDASVAEAIAAADRAAAQAAAEAAEIDRQQREDAAEAAAADAAAAQAARDAIRERDLGTGPQFEGGVENESTGPGYAPGSQANSPGNPGNPANQREGGDGGNGGGGGGGYTGGGWCFDPSTPIQMADGSTKEIKNIQLGDDTKGGEVTGVFQFKAADEIHDYKGVTVAGSHFVKEDG